MSLSLPTGLDVRADVWYGVLQFLLDDPRAMLSLTQVSLLLPVDVSSHATMQYRQSTQFVTESKLQGPFLAAEPVLW